MEGLINLRKKNNILLFSLIILLFAGCNSAEKDSLNREHEKNISEIKRLHWQETELDTTVIKLKIEEAKANISNNSSLARAMLMESLYYSSKKNYAYGMFDAYRQMGVLFESLGQYDSSLNYLKLSYHFSKKIEDRPVYEIMALNNMGVVYMHLSKMDSASFYLYKGLNVLEKNKAKIPAVNALDVYIALSQFWMNWNDNAKALAFCNQAQALYSSINNASDSIKIVNMVADIYQNLNNFDSAIYLYSSVINSKLLDTPHLIYAHLNLGNVYSLKKDYAQSLIYFNNAFQISTKTNNKNDVARAYFRLGLANFHLGKYEQAELIFKEIVEQKENIRFYDEIEMAYQYLAEIYDLAKDFKQANEYRTQLIKLTNTRYPKELLKNIQLADASFRVKEKEQLLATQQLKLAHQKIIILTVSAAILLLAGLTIGLLRRKKHQEEMAKLKAMLAGEEKERVRMARELHDGVLSSLSAVKINFTSLPLLHPDQYNQEPFKQSLKQLEQSIQELRTTSHSLFPQVLQQEGLANAIRIFCEKISKIAPVSLDFQLIGTLPALTDEFKLGIYRMVQELVQNIMKHSGATHAEIQMTAQHDRIGISIADNGIGMAGNPSGNDEGIGLQQIRQQVKAMNGSLEIEQDEGTSIYLDFDLHTT